METTIESFNDSCNQIISLGSDENGAKTSWKKSIQKTIVLLYAKKNNIDLNHACKVLNVDRTTRYSYLDPTRCANLLAYFDLKHKTESSKIKALMRHGYAELLSYFDGIEEDKSPYKRRICGFYFEKNRFPKVRTPELVRTGAIFYDGDWSIKFLYDDIEKVMFMKKCETERTTADKAKVFFLSEIFLSSAIIIAMRRKEKNA